MSEIKHWLIKGPGRYCRFHNDDFQSMSFDEIVRGSHRELQELLITRSSSLIVTTGVFYHWVSDEFHETLKGKYTLAWVPRHAHIEMIVDASESFMVQWRLEHGFDVPIEEITDIPKRHRLVLYQYEQLDDIPANCNSLPYLERIDWYNDIVLSGKYIPDFGPNDNIEHNWTLQKVDSAFLKDDKYFIYNDTILGRKELTLDLFVTDSRFSEIVNHFENAYEIA